MRRDERHTMLRLADAWTWDFWLADDGRSYHLYFLQAPRSIGHPDVRHWNVCVGHAVSPDLADWTVVSDAITPSDGPAFDDVATWTGSVVRGRDGTWFMFYTGVGSREHGPRQRIGLATSADLQHWIKHPGSPVLDSDPAGTNDSRTRCGSTRRGAIRGYWPTPTVTAGTCS
jgi:beta-fructofuranosidase